MTELTAQLENGGTEAGAIIASTTDLVLAARRLEPIDGIAHVYTSIVPNDHACTIEDLEKYADRPRAKRGHANFTTTESLARYLNTHRLEGTTCYAQPEELTVTAIIDDHAEDEARHGRHRATLKLQLTPAAERWLGAHQKYLGQEDFAQLIEDGLTEIAKPDGATVLEIAQSIRATKSASFRSDKRLATGRVQFQWVEELAAAAGSDGNLEIPEIVQLVFVPFYGADPIQIDARFRYRINGGKLALGFWLIRSEEKLRESFDAELGKLENLTADDATKTAGLVALWGTPGR